MEKQIKILRRMVDGVRMASSKSSRSAHSSCVNQIFFHIQHKILLLVARLLHNEKENKKNVSFVK